MNRIISTGLLALVLAAPVHAQPPWPPYWPNPYPPYPVVTPARVPNLDGVWYLTGNPLAVCQVQQRWPSTQALFINERGSVAGATIIGSQVWIPTWGEGARGLMGRIEGDRIIWPDGNFWSRWRVSPW
jgi:hypothetical protein